MSIKKYKDRLSSSINAYDLNSTSDRQPKQHNKAVGERKSVFFAWPNLIKLSMKIMFTTILYRVLLVTCFSERLHALSTIVNCRLARITLTHSVIATNVTFRITTVFIRLLLQWYKSLTKLCRSYFCHCNIGMLKKH